MAVRDQITSAGLNELRAAGDGGKPTQEQLDRYFQAAGLGWKCQNDADKHSRNNWCGFFACYCLQTAGLTSARWQPGLGIVGPVKKIWGYKGVQPGDVAVLAHDSHHIVITQVNPSFVADVEGNGKPPDNNPSLGGVITTAQRPISAITAYYQIQA
jgi:hypothetical protein